MKFGVSNLRRLKSSGPFDLKPITLLVGRNSGGKSTYLRSLPLLRQSIQTRTSSPILWFGDLVDFGTLEEAVSKYSENEAITFSFEDDVKSSRRQRHYFTQTGEPIFTAHQVADHIGMQYSVDVVPFQSKNRLSRVRIELSEGDFPLAIEMAINDAGTIETITLNGRDVTNLLSGQRLVIETNNLFPYANFSKKSSSKEAGASWYGYPGDEIAPAIFNFLRHEIDGRVRDHTLRSLSDKLIVNGLPSSRSFERSLVGQGKIVRQKIYEIVNQKGASHTTLYSLIVLGNIPRLMRDIGEHFRTKISGTLYIGPARARSERYYRYQDLAVNEIDPDGQNFPMFLNSLSRTKQDSFSNWVKELYGYGVSVSQRSGHISITLLDRDVEANIVDVGYGISQVLPVLGQIWWAQDRAASRPAWVSSPILAIEQPELHLHPAHQAILAKAFSQNRISLSSDDKRTPLTFLIETHSEVLVNRLGRMIADGNLNSDDVQIILFEPSEAGEHTTTRVATYDKDGVLENWPYGFFLPN